jgi:hypothetical protein
MEPVIYSATVKHDICLHHSLHPNPKDSAWVVLTSVVDDNIPYYINKASGEAYDAEGKLCGRYFENKGLFLFEEARA